MDDLKQARALPFWGKGEAPATSGPSRGPEEQGFVAIVRIFVRTWPYLLPQVLGRWRELPRRSSAANAAPSDAAHGAWSFRHVPPLVTVLTAVGAFFWLAPPGTDWLHDLLLAATVLMTLLVWALLFVKGQAYLAASLALVVIATAAFLFAVFAVDGLADNVHVGARLGELRLHSGCCSTGSPRGSCDSASGWAATSSTTSPCCGRRRC